METWMVIGGGGFIGALLRYWISGWVYQWLGARMPWGTLAVNIMGSFALGFFITLINTRLVVSDNIRNLIAIGLLGALTTFSTFSYETVALFQEGLLLKGMFNILLNVILSLIFLWSGIILARLV